MGKKSLLKGEPEALIRGGGGGGLGGGGRAQFNFILKSSKSLIIKYLKKNALFYDGDFYVAVLLTKWLFSLF
ncbi:MAG: hypothetical protein ABIK94_05065 [candidate division WOR-3 bacterium]